MIQLQLRTGSRKNKTVSSLHERLFFLFFFVRRTNRFLRVVDA